MTPISPPDWSVSRPLLGGVTGVDRSLPILATQLVRFPILDGNFLCAKKWGYVCQAGPGRGATKCRRAVHDSNHTNHRYTLFVETLNIILLRPLCFLPPLAQDKGKFEPGKAQGKKVLNGAVCDVNKSELALLKQQAFYPLFI